MKNKKYIDNKSDRLVQLESHIQTGSSAKGLAFEKFMKDFFKGKLGLRPNGQFLTPREGVKFTVDMMEPKSELGLRPNGCA